MVLILKNLSSSLLYIWSVFLEKSIQKEIATYEKEMENAKAEYEKAFPYEDLLKEKLKQQVEINTRLEIKDTEEIVADVPEEEISVPQMTAAVR